MNFEDMSDEELDAALSAPEVKQDSPFANFSDAELDAAIEGPKAGEDLDTLGGMISIANVEDPFNGRQPSLTAPKLSVGEGLDNAATQMKGMAAGAARFPLGVAYLGEQVWNTLPGADATKVEEWIKENEQYIKDNQLEGDALMGEIATSIAGGIVTGGIKSVTKLAATEAAIEGTISKGTGESNIEAGERALIAGAFTASST